MTSLGLTRRVFLWTAAVAAVVKPLSGHAAETVVGSVADVRGTAHAAQAGKTRVLAPRAAVLLDDTLTTAAQSRLRAHLAGKTTLRLGAGTRLRIDKFIVNAGGELVLGSGALLLDAPAALFKDRLTVDSPFALIAVRGTRFFAGDIEGTFGVFVERGRVDVRAGGKRVRLRAGQGTDIAKPGDPPGPVKTWGKPKIAKAMALVR